MSLPLLPLLNFITGRQLLPGSWANAITTMLTGTTTGITATPAGTAANSFQLNSAFNEITTVATANDSVTLPPAKSGLRVCVTNSDGADSALVFANGADTIKGAASLAVAAGACVLFICTKDGIWRSWAAA